LTPGTVSVITGGWLAAGFPEVESAAPVTAIEPAIPTPSAETARAAKPR
jgi:hypothetical protein